MIYLPLAIYDYYQSDFSFVKSLVIYIRDFFVLGEHYNSWPLWYVLASIYALIIMRLLSKFVAKYLTLTCVLLILFGFAYSFLLNYLLSLDGTSIQFILSKTLRNDRFAAGFIYIPIGFLIWKYRQYLNKAFSNYSWLLLFVLCFVLNFVVENKIAGNILGKCVVVALFLFVITSEKNVADLKSVIFRRLRFLSTGGYFIHMWVWTIYYTLVYQEKTSGVDSFVITTVIAIILSLLYLIVRNWLKKTRKSCLELVS